MSAIAWTDHTLNPVIGCSKVSPGCAHCYAPDTAAALARRFPRGAGARYLRVLDPSGKRWSGTVWLDRKAMTTMRVPRSKRVRGGPGMTDGWRPARVFLGSMTDLFHESLPLHDLREVWSWMGEQGGRDKGPIWQVVTKRPERARELLPQLQGPLFNGPRVHLLTSTEDQEHADLRIPHVLACRPWVEVVGISAEPLLGPIVLRPEWLDPHNRLQWVIVGAESGAGARPMQLAWAEDLVVQARAGGAAPFVKQLGQRPVLGYGYHVLEHAQRTWPGGKDGVAPVVHDDTTGRVTAWLRDRKGGDPTEWPAHLRVREWPA